MFSQIVIKHLNSINNQLSNNQLNTHLTNNNQLLNNTNDNGTILIKSVEQFITQTNHDRMGERMKTVMAIDSVREDHKFQIAKLCNDFNYALEQRYQDIIEKIFVF